MLTVVMMCVQLLVAQQPNVKVERAVSQMRQAAYELGIHLALQETNSIKGEFRAVWSSISKVRSLALPANIKSQLTEALAARGSPTAVKDLEELTKAVDAVATTQQKQLLARLIEQAKSNQFDRYHDSLLEFQDQLVGTMINYDLPALTKAVRSAEKELGSNPTKESMDRALAYLTKLPTAADAKYRAVSEAIEVIDSTLASAIDLYSEGRFQDADAMLNSVNRPFRILSKVDDPKMQLRCRQLYDEIALARRSIVVGDSPYRNWNFGESRGFRSLNRIRREMVVLLEVYELKNRRTSPGGGR